MPEKHLIKKYANRKLYDTQTSRYITLDGISELVRDGHDIEVQDRESGRDLTPLILSQIVTSEQKRHRNGGSGTDHSESGGVAILDYVRRTLNVPAAIVSGEVGRRRGDLEDLIDLAIERALERLSIPSRRDIETLNKRLDALDRRLARLAPAKPRTVKSLRTRKAAGRP